MSYTGGLYINDAETMTTNQVLATIYDHIRDYNIDVAAIDHLNLVSFPAGHTQQDKEQLPERLRTFAKEHNIVLFPLVQVKPGEINPYYFTTLEQHAGSIILVDLDDKDFSKAKIELEGRDAAWGLFKYEFKGNLQLFKKPDGGGYHVPSREWRRLCTAGPGVDAQGLRDDDNRVTGTGEVTDQAEHRVEPREPGVGDAVAEGDIEPGDNGGRARDEEQDRPDTGDDGDIDWFGEPAEGLSNVEEDFF